MPSIIRNSRDLWGMAAIGEILSLGGGLSFITFHFTTRQLPSAILSSASVCSLLLPSGDCAL